MTGSIDLMEFFLSTKTKKYLRASFAGGLRGLWPQGFMALILSL